MEMERYGHGVPSWVDVSTPDLDGARAFYSALFGWDAPEGSPEFGGYTMGFINAKPVAGIGPQMNPAAPPVWTTYVNVDDADSVVAKVGPAGGHVIVEPMSIPGVGRMALFADPTGAIIGIWQPDAHKGAALVNEPNTYCWSELMTTDVEGAKVFYAAVFGWGAETSIGEDMTYTEWKVDGHSVGGMLEKPPTVPAEVPPSWGVYFAVDDIDATIAKIATLGGAVIMGPMAVQPGTFAIATDPAGAVFSTIALSPTAPT